MALSNFIHAEYEHLQRHHEGVMLAMRGIESLGAENVDENDIAAVIQMLENFSLELRKSMTSLGTLIDTVDAFPKQPKKEEDTDNAVS